MLLVYAKNAVYINTITS